MTSKVCKFTILAAAIASILLPATVADAQQRSRYSYDQPSRQDQRALIEELRRNYAKRKGGTTVRVVREHPAVIKHRSVVAVPPHVIERRHVVYDPPRVVEHRRIVEDPPRVIERYHVVEDCTMKRGLLNSIFWSWSNGACR